MQYIWSDSRLLCARISSIEQVRHDMQFVVAEEPSASCRWTSRIGLFSVLLIIATLFLHRLFAMPTPVAFNVLGLAYMGGALALITGLAALLGIWRYGEPGGARAALGIVVGGGILAAPLLLVPLAHQYPAINDVTTDVTDPPTFEALAAERKAPFNPARYPGAAFAKIQLAAFPDLKPLIVNRAPGEAFELVVDAMKKLRYTMVSERPPADDESSVGHIEAVDRTLILGFYDDIAARVVPDPEGARIDLRSSSRFGELDFGQNATRLRELMRQIGLRLESTVPSADGEIRPRKPGDPKQENPRTSRDRARQDVQRGQGQKAQQQRSDERRARDRPQRQPPE